MLVVLPNDLIGFEIKGPKDKLSDGRLQKQLREFNFYLPEVWLVVDPKWEKHEDVQWATRNLLVVDGAGMRNPNNVGTGQKGGPDRDEMCCSRLLELLWVSEAARIAQRTILPGPVMRRPDVRKLRKQLARLLTGHEIMKQVCQELRARPLVGLASDAPMRTEKAAELPRRPSNSAV